MKTNDTRYVFGCRRVIADVVRRHPVFVAPVVTQQHQHEPGEVENEFLARNRSAKGWYSPAQCGRFVRENEKRVTKQQVEKETERRQHRDGSPKRLSWKPQIRPAAKPPAKRADRDE